MTNLLQIKRSTANATVTGLQAGELAFTQAGNTFFVGAPDGTSGSIRIGGQMVPGTLTANQALVANSTSGIDKVIVANLVANSVWANGAAGNPNDVLTSNGTAIFWKAPVTVITAGAGLTGGGTSGNVTLDVVAANGISVSADAVGVLANSGLVANSTGLHIVTSGDATLIANSSGLFVNDATISIATSQLTGDVALGTNTSGNYVASISTANGIAGAVANAEGTTPSLYVVANNGIVSNSSGVFAAASNGISVTSAGINVLAATGGGLVSNSSGVFVTPGSGLSVNATGVQVVAGTGGGLVSNGSGVFVISGNGISVNATGVHVVAGANGGLLSNSSGVFVTTGNGLLSNSSGLFVTAGSGIVSNATGVHVLAGTDGGLVSNGSGVFVTAGDGLVSNATGVHVVGGNGISTSSDALAVAGGSTLTVNSSGAHVNSTLSITSLTTTGDVLVNGNTKLGDSTSDVASINARVNTSIVATANITYDLGENLLRWKNVYSSHVESVSGEFSGSLTIGGDLTVSGNLTTVNVSSLSVTDPLIKLATNNTIGDTLYIGFTGHYNGSGNASNHTGLIRQPSNKNFYLFSTYGDETKVNNNEIIVTDPSFSLANLNTYLLSGGLVTNATHVAITANSTVNVAIIANTLTLSTALAGTSGGTGRSSTTNNALLVGNSSNGYTELTLGTSGFVLQSNGTALIYDTIDGGTF